MTGQENITAKGERRAWVTLERLDALWFNTGTLCNLSCGRCYIESSPCNDRLVYLSAAEVAEYLDEIAALGALLGHPGTISVDGNVRDLALGDSLAEAERSVPLNHPHCAKFCVLGGGSCKT